MSASPWPALVSEDTALGLLDSTGVDGVIACSPEAISSLTGHSDWMGRQMREWMVDPTCEGVGYNAGFAILAADGRIALSMPAVMAHDVSHIDGLHLELYGNVGEASRAHPDARTALAQGLVWAGLTSEVIAVEFQGAPVWLESHLGRVAPRARVGDGSTLLRILRMVKNERGIEEIRRVTRVTEESLRSALLEVGLPTSSDQVRAVFEREILNEGIALDHFAWGAPGGFSVNRSQPITEHRSIFVDVGGFAGGVFSDLGLAVSYGDAPQIEVTRYQRAYGAVMAGQEMLMPGTRSSEVYDPMHAFIADIPGLTAQGHGLAFSIREFPFIRPDLNGRVGDDFVNADVDFPIQDGMVVNLEVPGWFADHSSMQCEITLHVTSLGAEAITDQQRTQIWEIPT